jgi:hypothetical protein
MVKEASLTVLDVLSEFLDDFKADITLPPEESDLLQPCFDLLMGLMRKEQSAAFLSSAFRSLAVFAHDLRKTLFVHKNPIFLGDMLFDVLRYANANNGLIRSEAAALVYLLWRMNQEVRHRFSHALALFVESMGRCLNARLFFVHWSFRTHDVGTFAGGGALQPLQVTKHDCGVQDGRRGQQWRDG